MLEQGQKWQLSKRGLYKDPEKEKKKKEHLYNNRLTKEKWDEINGIQKNR